jgi:hypothetical protein
MVRESEQGDVGRAEHPTEQDPQPGGFAKPLSERESV